LHEFNKKKVELRKNGRYSGASMNATLLSIMKIFALRTALGLSLATILAACGSGAQIDQPTQTAAMIETGNAAQVATANSPAPDCAADGCKGLRIIDANAEAYRYEAMRRAAADAPQS
jgi:hypothetical protein